MRQDHERQGSSDGSAAVKIHRREITPRSEARKPIRRRSAVPTFDLSPLNCCLYDPPSRSEAEMESW
jgi:hypothetical protein